MFSLIVAFAWALSRPLGGPITAPPSTPAASASPSQVAVVHFQSAALAGEATYRVYLPPGYVAAAGQRYPLVVLLHGLGGQGADWFDATRGALDQALDQGIAAGALAPFIAVAPDGHNGYWTDHIDHLPGHAFGRFVDEVAADAESRYRIAPNDRAIVGVSMGGHGAMLRALAEPTRWRAVVSVAGALFGAPPTHRPIYKEVWGNPADLAYWQAESPMGLLQTWPAKRPLPPIFLACGNKDTERFLDLTLAAEKQLNAMGTQPPVVITEGAHTWHAWRQATPRWLPWLERYLVR